jgi:hypothetical protein
MPPKVAMQAQLPGHVATAMQSPLILQANPTEVGMSRYAIDATAVGAVCPVLPAEPRSRGVVKVAPLRHRFQAGVLPPAIAALRKIATARNAHRVARTSPTIGVGDIAEIAKISRTAPTFETRCVANVTWRAHAIDTGQIAAVAQARAAPAHHRIIQTRSLRTTAISVRQANSIPAVSRAIADIATQAVAKNGACDIAVVLWSNFAQSTRIALRTNPPAIATQNNVARRTTRTIRFDNAARPRRAIA